VTPHYAVKCNPNSDLIKTLNKFKGNNLAFDCASKHELDHIDSMIPNINMTDRVILSNPRKKTMDLQAASRHKLTLTVADCEEELQKNPAHL